MARESTQKTFGASHKRKNRNLNNRVIGEGMKNPKLIFETEGTSLISGGRRRVLVYHIEEPSEIIGIIQWIVDKKGYVFFPQRQPIGMFELFEIHNQMIHMLIADEQLYAQRR